MNNQAHSFKLIFSQDLTLFHPCFRAVDRFSTVLTYYYALTILHHVFFE